MYPTNIATELGYFQRQALIEKLTLKFAQLNGYQIEENLNINDAQHPQIKMWMAMAQMAVSELEKEITESLKQQSDLITNADITAFSQLGEDAIDELMDVS
jgi:uncharacterized protein YaaW (UPF0174 family)